MFLNYYLTKVNKQLTEGEWEKNSYNILNVSKTYTFFSVILF